MKNIKTLFFLIIGFLALTACQTVTTKINKTTEQEKKELKLPQLHERKTNKK